MRETRSTFGLSQHQIDVNMDINDEYNEFLDIATAASAQYAKVMDLAKTLQAALAAKQVELDQQASRYRQDVAYHKACAERARGKLQATSARLNKYKSETEALRQHNKHLSKDLKAATAKLEHVKHLCCDICMDSLKNVVTGCGHGYCSDCLSTWLRQRSNDDNNDEDNSDMDSLTEQMESNCPICRKVINANQDVWPIFVENEGGTSSEVVYVDSDND
ncbi:hypothetical protein DV737_g2633, partial [Chaetothyriales sp. CBS 132003]